MLSVSLRRAACSSHSTGSHCTSTDTISRWWKVENECFLQMNHISGGLSGRAGPNLTSFNVKLKPNSFILDNFTQYYLIIMHHYTSSLIGNM